jgi:hypothetical protein
MTNPAPINNYTTDYLQLTTGGPPGAAELDASGSSFGVLADDQGHPALLLTRSGPAPLIQIDADAGMERVTYGDVIHLINKGAPCLVAVRDSQPVGILTAKTVADYVMENFRVATGAMGDQELHGNPPSTPLTLTCATCGAENRVVYFAEGETCCVNGHLLAVAWE